MKKIMDEKGRIEKVIFNAFNVGKNKDISIIREIHMHNRFSKFSDVPPYNLQTYDDACLYEELYFANISDYEFNIEDLRIDIFNDIALCTFIIVQRGVLVDNYNFTGSIMNVKSRVSMVLKKEGNEWLILHEHLSRF